MFCSFYKAQNKTIDSLKLALKNAKHDTVRCNVLLILAETAPEDEWVNFNNQLLKLSEEKAKSDGVTEQERRFYQKKSGASFCMMGYLEMAEGDLIKSLEHYTEGLKRYEASGNKPGIAFALHQTAYLLQNQGNIQKALEYNSRSLKIKEETGDKMGIALSLNSIATILHDQGDKLKALEYYIRSLEIQEEIGDKEGVAQSLNNIGAIYDIYGDPKVKSSKDEALKAGRPKALEYYSKSLKLYEELGDKKGIATALNNIGVTHGKLGDESKALEYYAKSLEIRESIKDRKGIAYSLHCFGQVYLKRQNYQEALKFALRSMSISKELQFAGSIRNAAELLNKIYKATGNHKLALENYELYIQMRDSVNNENTRKASIKQQLKYDYEKQAAADSVAHAKENEVKNAQLAQQEAEISKKKNQQYALFGGLALVLVFAGFMYNRFKITQKQKIIIEEKEKETQKQNAIISQQKSEVEEKQKQILDSIHYAKRIQKALLPTEKSFGKSLDKLNKK